MNHDPKTSSNRTTTNGYAVVTAPGTVRLERILPGPIERVWEYLTDSEKRGSWLGSGEMDLRVGGRVELIFHNNALTENDEPPPAKYAQYAEEKRMVGRITACDPPRLLGYTWPEESGEDTEVSFELTPDGDHVLLVLTHRRLSSRDDMIAVSGGWHAHLGTLADRLSDRTPAGFWASFKRLEAEYRERIPEED